MSRKANLEDTVLTYFQTAPLPAAELMLRIASSAVKRRQGPRLSETPAARSSRRALATKQTENEKPADSPRRLANVPTNRLEGM